MGPDQDALARVESGFPEVGTARSVFLLAPCHCGGGGNLEDSVMLLNSSPAALNRRHRRSFVAQIGQEIAAHQTCRQPPGETNSPIAAAVI